MSALRVAQKNKMHVLKQGNKSVSLVDMQRHYVIGFQSPLMARKVHYNLHPDASERLRVERAESIDITRDITQRLEDLGVPFQGECVSIDTRALLFVPKVMSGGSTATDPANDAGMHLSVVDFAEFMLYPFEHNLGVIMPYDLLHERPHEFIFRSHVIDPCFDLKSFMRTLS